MVRRFPLGVVGAILTAFYMFRLVHMTFHGEFRGSEEAKHHLHESPWTMTLPLQILAVLSIVGGFIGIPGQLFGRPELNKIESFLEPVMLPIHWGGHDAAGTCQVGNNTSENARLELIERLRD